MLQNLDESLFPFSISVFDTQIAFSNHRDRRVTLTFNNPRDLIEAYFTDSRIRNCQNDIDNVIRNNAIYRKWRSLSTAPSYLPHINQYSQTYSSTKYYKEYGSENLINELKAHSRILPMNQILYRGGAHTELPSLSIGTSFTWNVPKSTTLNIDTANNHAFSDCADKLRLGETDPQLNPTILILKIANPHVKGYVFAYGNRNSMKHEREILLSPDVTVRITDIQQYGGVNGSAIKKVVYADIFS